MPGAVDGWRAEVAGTFGYDSFGPVLLPHDEPVTLGRAEHCGLRMDDPAVSRHLATFRPAPGGWFVENGERTRMRIESTFVVEASFAARALVFLQRADWTLIWDLDVPVTVVVRYRPVGHGEPLPVARDGVPVRERGRPENRLAYTALAGDRLHLTRLQRRRLGALFAYLIEDEPKPDRLIPTAAELSGDSISQITGTAVKVMEYVNRHRRVPIEHFEDLGFHLVKVAGVLGPDDLPDARV